LFCMGNTLAETISLDLLSQCVLMAATTERDRLALTTG